MSNLLLRRDDGRDDGPNALTVRPVRRDEVPAAMRLILSSSNRDETTAMAEFMQVAVTRGLDLSTIWVVADAREKLQWAVLPMPIAGRTALLMVPPRLRPQLDARHVAESIAATLNDLQSAGVTLVQVILDPEHGAVQRSLIDSGFEEIADLVYLSRSVRNALRGRLLPERYGITQYDEGTHARFGLCIERTYIDSLDCPKLNGRRAINDIIEGHKAAGEFDPRLWMMLTDRTGEDLGVILLNRLQGQPGYELVYIGLTPEARGKGLADSLIRTALNALANEGGGQIVTACDATNAPARKMYHRHGFSQMYARKALVKELNV